MPPLTKKPLARPAPPATGRPGGGESRPEEKSKKALADLRVAVVGLGLMGGSLARALRGHCRCLTGLDRQPGVAAWALAQGWLDRAGEGAADALAGADLVVLATPVRATLSLLADPGAPWPPGAAVMDLGSTKRQVLRAMGALPEGVHPVGGHPMCGSERSGIRAADPALFRDRPFLVTPLARTPAWVVELAGELARRLGARPRRVPAGRHDQAVAVVSHLPYLLACALVAVAAGAGREPLVRRLAASGFRDTTRLAGSDVRMMLDILMTNRDNLQPALRRFRRQLQRLERLLAAGDEPALQRRLSAIRQARAASFPGLDGSLSRGHGGPRGSSK